MKRVGITAFALISMFALQGCSVAADDSEPKKVLVTSEETADVPASQPSGALVDVGEASAEGRFPVDFFTIPYQDSYKTIFLLDRAQVEAVAGVTLSGSTEQQVKEALGDAALWQSDERSAEHATLILEAFAREGDRTSQALRALQNDPRARLKVFVGHNSHRTIAHIEIDNED